MRTRLERIVFFGTPEFAVPTLEALVEAGRAPLLVVSQPSRRAGRGGRLTDPPVVVAARRHELEVRQVASVRDQDFLDAFAALAPDLAIVVAFGQIFPQALLDIPRHGCLNLHASLLPRHRGAAPIQAAIAAGDDATGVTTMQMEAGLDSGPILLQAELDIGGEETAGELSERLAERGALLVVETLEELEAGRVEPLPQDDSQATFAPRIKKEDGRIDWSAPAAGIEARLRAYSPWPGSFTELRGERLRVLAGRVVDDPGLAGAPGEFLGMDEGQLLIACGEGTVLGLSSVQRPGRRPVGAAEFLNGARLAVGDVFG